jgi:hypothetical protein
MSRAAEAAKSERATPLDFDSLHQVSQVFLSRWTWAMSSVRNDHQGINDEKL